MTLFILSLLSIAMAAPERCNGLDDNGDGQVDEGPVWVSVDADGDGFGSAADAFVLADCADLSPNDVSDARDPDDSDPAIYPGAPERCNGLDDNGDGQLDENACGCDAVTAEPDIYQVCTSPLTWAEANVVCEDDGYHLATARTGTEQSTLADAVAPYAVEFWIGLTDVAVEGTFAWSQGSTLTYSNWRLGEPNDSEGIEDCAEIEPSGLWDDNDCSTAQGYVCEINCTLMPFYVDSDGDGLGNPDALTEACVQPAGTVRNAADCDDSDSALPRVFFVDQDGDGFGSEETIASCGGAITLVGGDCDDADSTVNPAEPEIEGDGIDTDCDGSDSVPVEPPDDDPLETTARSERTEVNGTLPTRKGETSSPDDETTFSYQPSDPGSARRVNPARADEDRDYGFGVGCSTQPTALGWGLLALLALRRRSIRSPGPNAPQLT